MAVPEPNSPEALRAAQKVRNVFYMIAAANLVVIAIVMWPRPKLKRPSIAQSPVGLTTPTSSDPLIREMESVHARLLAACAARDVPRLAELFSAHADPPPSEQGLRALISRYGTLLADVEQISLSNETKPDPAGGVLVCAMTSKHGLRGTTRTTFRRENGQLRVLAWHLEEH
jgi:hypothetical protein